ncbi:MAG: MoxR family ATPase [Thaumarchaeota archaeon]|nr:MoxR family ATPase [Candidatus Calditenuaceae archaeon]
MGDEERVELLGLHELRDVVRRVVNEIHKVIVGMDDAIEALLIALLTEGHVLMEGVPGLAKTYLAKYFAKTLNLTFSRIQITSDLLPSDITGSLVYDKSTGQFVFRKGPIFANLVLADEINRGPPRTQSALLEVMQERQVTVEGVSYDTPRPFMVIATQNPIELEGTFPLPEAQLDRFLVRVIVTHPEREQEIEVLRMKQVSGEEPEIKPVVGEDVVLRGIAAISSIRVDDSIMEYIVDIVRKTRQMPEVYLGASTRAEVALMYAAKAKAAISGCSYVTPDHIKSVAPLVLNHRIILRSRRKGPFTSWSEFEVIQRAIEEVDVPI